MDDFSSLTKSGCRVELMQQHCCNYLKNELHTYLGAYLSGYAKHKPVQFCLKNVFAANNKLLFSLYLQL